MRWGWWPREAHAPLCGDFWHLRIVWHDNGSGWRLWRPARFMFWKDGPMWEAVIGRLELRWRVHGEGRHWPHNPKGELWVLADQLRRPIRGRGRFLFESSVQVLRELRQRELDRA